MTADKPNPPDPKKDQPVEGKEIEEFFQRFPGNFRWPKPNAEAVAAAVEAIQRMSGGRAAAQDLAADGDADEPGSTCSACGGSLPAGARFCVWCGIPTQLVAGDAEARSRCRPTSRSSPLSSFCPQPGHGIRRALCRIRALCSARSCSRFGGPGSLGTSTGGRAEAGARQVVQDWAQACNTKHIDDLLELYAADATLIRSNLPPVRSLPAIREFLISLLEAGLGDVEMESLRVEVLGEIALDLGRCKMLVPVAMGKRREERGKYLVVLVRQPAGTWKILADCWSSDLAVNAPPPEPAARKVSEPIPPLRKPR